MSATFAAMAFSAAAHSATDCRHLASRRPVGRELGAANNVDGLNARSVSFLLRSTSDFGVFLLRRFSSTNSDASNQRSNAACTSTSVPFTSSLHPSAPVSFRVPQASGLSNFQTEFIQPQATASSPILA